MKTTIIMERAVNVNHEHGWIHLLILLNQGWRLKYGGLNLVVYYLVKDRAVTDNLNN